VKKVVTSWEHKKKNIKVFHIIGWEKSFFHDICIPLDWIGMELPPGFAGMFEILTFDIVMQDGSFRKLFCGTFS